MVAMIWRSCVVSGSFVGVGAEVYVIIRNCLLIGVKRRSRVFQTQRSPYFYWSVCCASTTLSL
ncbi:MAG: hypothetical protein ACYTXT_39960 [Nostoc sp.]